MFSVFFRKGDLNDLHSLGAYSNSDTGFAEPDLVFSHLVSGFYAAKPEEVVDAD